MSQKLTRLNRKLLRKVFGVFSFTTALFIFQACYGTPQDFQADFLIEGTVKSANSGTPAEGIKITVNDDYMIYTDSNGAFEIYMMKIESYKLSLEDIDLEENGSFISKDTTLTPALDSNHIAVDILLNEK